MNENNWQEKVQKELQDLTNQLVSLRQFIASAEFRDLSHRQCQLLIDQSHLMMQYADVLSARLDEDLRNASN